MYHRPETPAVPAERQDARTAANAPALRGCKDPDSLVGTLDRALAKG